MHAFGSWLKRTADAGGMNNYERFWVATAPCVRVVRSGGEAVFQLRELWCAVACAFRLRCVLTQPARQGIA